MVAIETTNLRQQYTPVWQCSICGRRYQTKSQQQAHELKEHSR